jgi:hypothetical protein
MADKGLMDEIQTIADKIVKTNDKGDLYVGIALQKTLARYTPQEPVQKLWHQLCPHCNGIINDKRQESAQGEAYEAQKTENLLRQPPTQEPKQQEAEEGVNK